MCVSVIPLKQTTKLYSFYYVNFIFTCAKLSKDWCQNEVLTCVYAPMGNICAQCLKSEIQYHKERKMYPYTCHPSSRTTIFPFSNEKIELKKYVISTWMLYLIFTAVYFVNFWNQILYISETIFVTKCEHTELNAYIWHVSISSTSLRNRQLVYRREKNYVHYVLSYGFHIKLNICRWS